jgi:hypothetical protein
MVDQEQRANITELVESCTYGVSIVRMEDFSKGFNGHKLFSTGTMLPNVIGIEVTDSLSQYFKIGKIILVDQTQLAETFPFTGNEIIAVRYKNKANDANAGEKIVYFRVFDIQQMENARVQNANPGSKYIVIHLVEFPAFEMFSTSSIYKTWPNNQAKISDIVYDSLKSIKFIDQYYNIEKPEPTKDSINFWIPNWNMLKTLRYLQSYAVSEKNDPFYVLTIRQDDMSSRVTALKHPTIHYNSIFKLLKGKASRTFSSQRAEQKLREPYDDADGDEPDTKVTPSAKDDKDNSPPDVILGRMQKSFDGSMLFFGMNGETIVGRDALEGTMYFSTTFESFLQTYSGLGMWSTYQKDSNVKSWGNQWSTFSNSSYGPTIGKSGKVDAYFRNLYSKRMMLGANRIVIFTYTSEFRNPGEKVNIRLPSSDKEVGIDLMNSGDWMIWSIKDKITSSGRAVSEIELVRDSYFLIDSARINNFIPRINTLSTNNNIKG